jgi:hypothetical protein
MERKMANKKAAKKSKKLTDVQKTLVAVAQIAEDVAPGRNISLSVTVCPNKTPLVVLQDDDMGDELFYGGIKDFKSTAGGRKFTAANI